MPRSPAAEPDAAVAIDGNGDQRSVVGVLDLRSIDTARQSLQDWLKPGKSRQLELGRLSGLDTTGALFLCELRDRKVKLTGVSAEHAQLLELIGELDRKPLPAQKKMPHQVRHQACYLRSPGRASFRACAGPSSSLCENYSVPTASKRR